MNTVSKKEHLPTSTVFDICIKKRRLKKTKNMKNNIKLKQMETAKKTVLTLIMILSFMLEAFSQVTIGSGVEPDANALLDLKETGTSSTKGLLMPRVALISTDSYTPMQNHIEGMTVYNTAPGIDVTPGFYYNNGSKWIRVDSSAAWLISGTEDTSTSKTDNIYHLGHITIGKNQVPDPSAILDINTSDKGVLLPKVSLTSATDITTIPNPATGLLIYNVGTTTFPTRGYMFWNGTEWRLINTSTSVAPYATLGCGQATLDPAQVLQGGVTISGGTILKIPYTVGNGGIYNGATIYSTAYPTSDIKATISSGSFQNGSGYLAFNVTGTPLASQATPTGITFDLTPFYTANPSLDSNTGCMSVTVGTEVKANITSVAVMDNMKLNSDGGVTGYATQLTTPDGKFSVRAFIVSSDFSASAATFGTDSQYGMNLQIRNNTSSDVAIAGQFTWNWGGSGGNGAGFLGLQPSRWSGDDQQSIDNPDGIYWANYVSNDTGTGWAVAAAAPTKTNKSNRGYFINWGNPGVYALGRPERRTYSWTINDSGETKTAYILTFSSSSLNPTSKANALTCPNGICNQTKIFMKIDQITAP